MSVGAKPVCLQSRLVSLVNTFLCITKKVQEAWKCYTAEKEWKIFCFQKYINWSPEFLNAYKVVIIRDDIILSTPLFTQRQPGLAPAPRDYEF